MNAQRGAVALLLSWLADLYGIPAALMCLAVLLWTLPRRQPQDASAAARASNAVRVGAAGGLPQELPAGAVDQSGTWLQPTPGI